MAGPGFILASPGWDTNLCKGVWLDQDSYSRPLDGIQIFTKVCAGPGFILAMGYKSLQTCVTGPVFILATTGWDTNLYKGVWLDQDSYPRPMDGIQISTKVCGWTRIHTRDPWMGYKSIAELTVRLGPFIGPGYF